MKNEYKGKKKSSFYDKTIHIREYFEITGYWTFKWFHDGLLLLKNLKRDTKKYNINAINIIYNSLIKYPLLGFLPTNYFTYYFYKDTNKNSYRNYISFLEHIKISKVNTHMPWILNNKLQFHLYFQDKIKIPKLIAQFNPHNNKIHYYNRTSNNKVVIKPTYGKCGDGVKVVNSDRLEEILNKCSKDYIVEDFIEQHHLINKIFSGSVNTIRILTLKKNDRDFDAITAILRVGKREDVFVDNNSAGGLTIGVDIGSGTLKKGYTYYEFGQDEYTYHPKTKYKFYGKHIPFFKEVKEIAVSAHRYVPMFTIVGWDIAITENGPIIIEGNRTPDLNNIQPHLPMKNLLSPNIF